MHWLFHLSITTTLQCRQATLAAFFLWGRGKVHVLFKVPRLISGIGGIKLSKSNASDSPNPMLFQCHHLLWAELSLPKIHVLKSWPPVGWTQVQSHWHPYKKRKVRHQRKGHMRTQWVGGHPQTKGRGLRRNQICQHLDLRLWAFRTVRINLLFKPPSLCNSVNGSLSMAPILFLSWKHQWFPLTVNKV